jgi:hypothetical protein
MVQISHLLIFTLLCIFNPQPTQATDVLRLKYDNHDVPAPVNRTLNIWYNSTIYDLPISGWVKMAQTLRNALSGDNVINLFKLDGNNWDGSTTLTQFMVHERLTVSITIDINMETQIFYPSN